MTTRDNFDFISPLDTRYYGDDTAVYEKLHPYLSEKASIKYQLKVEQAIIATLEELDVAPRGIASRAAKAAAAITPAEVYEEEHHTHHNIRALVNCLLKRLPESDRGFVHLFATSADIQDTARSLMLRDFSRDVLLPEIQKLVTTISNLARSHADTPQIGRTHGRYAEPITVGYWLANFVMRITQRAESLARCGKELRGMYSGAVGAHNALALKWPHDPASVEIEVLQRLGLKPGDGSISTQVIQPEYLADYGHSLISTFGVLANIADDFRQLMRSEIEEIIERLDEYQVGSSTMPHKINPKNFENVKSLWKAFVPRMTTVYMDQISEHQRDLTNSASTRFFNDLVAATYYASTRLEDAIRKTEINLGAINENLRDSYGEIIAEPLYISLALAGHHNPYYKVRAFAIEARKGNSDIRSFLDTDPEVKELWKKMPEAHREILLDPGKYTGDASSRTHIVCDDAELRMTNLRAQLSRPSEVVSLELRAA